VGLLAVEVEVTASENAFCNRHQQTDGSFAHFHQEKAMRQTVLVSTMTAVITAIVSVWGTTAIMARSPISKAATVASTPVEVMRMMMEAKALPEERFDAY
jgi:hypothetical protein